MKKIFRYIVALAVLATLLCGPFLNLAVGPAMAADNTMVGLTSAEQDLGLEVVSLRPTAAGHMLDLRFRVVDPQKAAEPLSRKYKAYLTEVESQKTLEVPITKAGPMRQTTLEPKLGRIYFVLFGNPGEVVKPGQTVDVTIGPMKLTGLRVQTASAPFIQRPELDDEAMTKWSGLSEKRQADLLSNYLTCLEHCGGAAECTSQCQTSFEALLERAYQETLQAAKP